jgi:hypothetical protein
MSICIWPSDRDGKLPFPFLWPRPKNSLPKPICPVLGQQNFKANALLGRVFIRVSNFTLFVLIFPITPFPLILMFQTLHLNKGK